tara:strand:+ start:470 stop:622 length:153 start_codon:yes stop_codon:yes gene_type:complete
MRVGCGCADAGAGAGAIAHRLGHQRNECVDQHDDLHELEEDDHDECNGAR